MVNGIIATVFIMAVFFGFVKMQSYYKDIIEKLKSENNILGNRNFDLHNKIKELEKNKNYYSELNENEIIFLQFISDSCGYNTVVNTGEEANYWNTDDLLPKRNRLRNLIVTEYSEYINVDKLNVWKLYENIECLNYIKSNYEKDREGYAISDTAWVELTGKGLSYLIFLTEKSYFDIKIN